MHSNVPESRLRMNNRVKEIGYDIDITEDEVDYKAVVRTNDGEDCVDYFAQRVISTVSVGVLNNDLITFNPPMAYSHKEYNPYEEAQFIKIFYQFEEKFWDETEFVETVRDSQHRGECNHWQSLDHDRFLPGSGVIMCTMVTEAFEKLIDPNTRDLTPKTLDSLLDPLRLTYGKTFDPIDVYYPQINKDQDFGYGGYGNWQVGKTFTDFAKFFGGVDSLTDYCEHNGCSTNKEWILHLSGSASCYAQAETVHGALFAGKRSANFVLESMGYKVRVDGSECDVFWQYLK